MTINIKVTQDKFNEVIDLDDSFNLHAVRINRAYEYICEFVVDENGEYVGAEKAREMFRAGRIKRNEIGEYWLDFVKKVNEAFVNPTSGASLDEPS